VRWNQETVRGCELCGVVRIDVIVRESASTDIWSTYHTQQALEEEPGMNVHDRLTRNYTISCDIEGCHDGQL